jgi:hypothetical protein
MTTLDRMQILIERDQHQKLAEMARRKGRSASDLVREWVREGIAEEDCESRKERIRETMKRLDRFRAEFVAEHGVLNVDPIEEVRRESEEEIDRMIEPLIGGK